MATSGLHARLCHAFLVLKIISSLECKQVLQKRIVGKKIKIKTVKNLCISCISGQ